MTKLDNKFTKISLLNSNETYDFDYEFEELPMIFPSTKDKQLAHSIATFDGIAHIKVLDPTASTPSEFYTHSRLPTHFEITDIEIELINVSETKNVLYPLFTKSINRINSPIKNNFDNYLKSLFFVLKLSIMYSNHIYEIDEYIKI